MREDAMSLRAAAKVWLNPTKPVETHFHVPNCFLGSGIDIREPLLRVFVRWYSGDETMHWHGVVVFVTQWYGVVVVIGERSAVVLGPRA